MTKNIIVAVAAVSLALATSPVWAKTVPTVAPSELATYCAQSGVQGDANVLLDSGNGSPVALTMHCDGVNTVVGQNTDSGESEQGPTEAAENGVED